jgi:hypothetical protein
MKNLAFWMELNTPIKFLAFYISSFQSSWHFVFYISCGTKHSLYDMMMYRMQIRFSAQDAVHCQSQMNATGQMNATETYSVLSIAADFAVAEQEGSRQPRRGGIPTRGNNPKRRWLRLCLCADTPQLYSVIADVRVYRSISAVNESIVLASCIHGRHIKERGSARNACYHFTLDGITR